MKVNLSDLTMAVRGLFLVAKIRYPEYRDKFPESAASDAIEISDAQVFEFLDDAEATMVQMIKDRFSVELPEVDPDDWVDPTKPLDDDTPEVPYIGTNERVLATSPVDGRMSDTSIWQDKFVFENKLGPDFGKSFTVVWSDGNRLEVPDSSKMAMNGSQSDYRKFQPGGKHSHNNPDIPYMEVYAKRGTHPEEVSIVVPK